MRRGASVLLVLVLLAMHADDARATWPETLTGELPACVFTGSQFNTACASDGVGGILIAWNDQRVNNPWDIYAQHISADGRALWGASGVLVCGAADRQQKPAITSDGAGGAIVAWEDQRTGDPNNTDLYVQRISEQGAALWTPNGVAVCTAANAQEHVAILSDSSGGAFLAWSDPRGGTYATPYASRVSGEGVLQWNPQGNLIGVTWDGSPPGIGPDGFGGFIVAWTDSRTSILQTLFAQRVAANGAPLWNSGGVPASDHLFGYEAPTVIPDGSGGGFIGWSPFGPYAQHLSSAGARLWGTTGVGLNGAFASSAGLGISVAADGLGGIFYAWRDHRSGTWDIYAQHLSSAGSALWTANGVAVGTAAGDQLNPTVLSDQAGGSILVWEDPRSGTSAIYAQRLSSSGAAQWAPGGLLVCSNSEIEENPKAIRDGAGGVIVSWEQHVSLGGSDIYAKRVLDSGAFLNPQPSIASVRDVAGDQGGFDHLTWNASSFDGEPAFGVSAYSVLRRTAAGTWQTLGTAPARAEAGYALIVPTYADSGAGPIPRTTYMIGAQNRANGGYWYSAPDSGYSVDNLSPATPQELRATVSGDGVSLDWAADPESDLAGYRLYGGSSQDFEPDLSHLIASVTGTSYRHAGGAAWYRLTAVDVHGNQSASALVAGDPARAAAPALRLAPPAPNPMNRHAQLVFETPGSGRVRFAAYDLAGRVVRTFVDGSLDAGPHTVDWNGRDAHGRPVAPGLYLVRLETAAGTLTRRIAVLGR